MRYQYKNHIEETPGTCGGKPRVAGRRIRVQDLALWYEDLGMTPEQLVEEYGLTLADVHAALAFYYDNKEQIQEDIRRSEEFVEEFKKNNPETVRDLREREIEGNADSVSSG